MSRVEVLMGAARGDTGKVRRSASEYEQARRVIKRMRLNKEQAKDVARRAYEADIKNKRPDIALKCAKEFDLGDSYVTRAATVLFMELINRRNYPKALEIARSYNLAHGGKHARRALEKAGALKDQGAQGVIDEIGGLARAASSARLEVSQADQAIDLIFKATQLRDKDPHVQGRAVLLPEGPGDVWLAGDLHGNVNNLKRLAALADLKNNPNRTLILQEIVHARLITADNRDLSFVAIMEAIKLMVEHPGQVYYLLGNHDLALNLRRELVKGGKFLNRYLFRGMAYMYRSRYEDVLEAYREFIGNMPAAIISPNGVFMSHSTPKRPFIPTLSREFLTETAADLPYNKLKPIVAMVNGREYGDDAAEEFADRLECDVMLCGHTPTSHGFTVKNKRHLIVDSQHPKARYVAFDKEHRYECAEELAEELAALYPDSAEREIEGELL